MATNSPNAVSMSASAVHLGSPACSNPTSQYAGTSGSASLTAARRSGEKPMMTACAGSSPASASTLFNSGTTSGPHLISMKARFLAGTAAAFSVLLLEPNVAHAARVFWDRTLGWQLGRDSPFSIWDWGQYHAAGIPDLAILHKVVIGLVVLLALALAVVPRRRTPLTLAALTAALLIGFQLTLTHWFYLYLPWVLPFALLWLLLPQAEAQETATRRASIEDALPVAASQSISAPSIRTPP